MRARSTSIAGRARRMLSKAAPGSARRRAAWRRTGSRARSRHGALEESLALRTRTMAVHAGGACWNALVATTSSLRGPDRRAGCTSTGHASSRATSARTRRPPKRPGPRSLALLRLPTTVTSLAGYGESAGRGARSARTPRRRGGKGGAWTDWQQVEGDGFDLRRDRLREEAPRRARGRRRARHHQQARQVQHDDPRHRRGDVPRVLRREPRRVDRRDRGRGRGQELRHRRRRRVGDVGAAQRRSTSATRTTA